MRTSHALRALSLVAVAGAFRLVGCSSDSNSLNQPLPAGGGACSADTDCGGSTAVCDLLAKRCVQCQFDTQCSSGDRCRANTCVTPTPCSSSLDCASLPAATICDPISSECVECAESVDCSGTADCIDNACVPYTACESSLECPKGNVCNTGAGRCVQCVESANCPEGNMCIANKCEVRTECVSDNQCTPEGKLCDKTLGYCVTCLTNDQCPDAYHCEAGACALNACLPGTSKCEGNSVVACSATGQSWGAPVPCPQSTTCLASGSQASCELSECLPGQTYCQADKLITCSAEGQVTSSVDCAAQGKHCSLGQCAALSCTPNTIFCDGQDVRQCDAAGASSFVLQTCQPGQSCNPASASCVDQLCTPGTPACNGSIATTCNAAGDGYAAGGTDCALQGKTCDTGVCTGCPAGGGPPTNVRMGEFFMGDVDYITVTNLGGCSAQLDTLAIHIASNNPLAPTMDFDFPAYELAANASAYVIFSATLAGDISAPDLANFLLPSLGEWVSLCQGPCSGGVILDYFAHADGGQPPAAPAGVTFTPAPLTGITDANKATSAYKRVGYTGAYPAFKAGDWQVAAASRPQ